MGAGITDPVERLYHIHDVMNGLKNSPIAQVQYSVQESILPKLPLSIGRQTVFYSFWRQSLIFFNLPGPTYPCLFANKLATGCQMIFNNLLPQVAILSYNERIFMNIILDPVAFPSSENLTVYFRNVILQLLSQSDIEYWLKIMSIVNSCYFLLFVFIDYSVELDTMLLSV